MGRPLKYSETELKHLADLYKTMKAGSKRGDDVVGDLTLLYKVSRPQIYYLLHKAGVHNPHKKENHESTNPQGNAGNEADGEGQLRDVDGELQERGDGQERIDTDS